MIMTDFKMSAWLVLVFLQFISVSRAQSCLHASNGERDLPNFVRPNDNNLRFRTNPIQAIITSYQFDCCGVITEWRAYVERSGGSNQAGAYSISFQVWRPNSPSPVDTDGCYTMIGVNHFMNIIFSDNPRGQITVSPSVDERIEVQPGDVIGFYLTSSRFDDDGIQFTGDDDNDSPYNQETVWYATSSIATSGDLTCQFPVGISGVLSSSTNLAPLIRASVTTYGCPTSTSTVTMYTSIPAPTDAPIRTGPTTVTTEPIDDGWTLTLQPTQHHPITTDTSTTPQKPELVDIGLIAGVTVPVIIVIILIVSVIVVILTCVVMKRRSKQLQESSEMVMYSQVNPVSNQTEEGPYYSSMEIQPSTTKNEAYGKLTQATSTDVDTYDYINDPPNDPTIPTSQNAAYGDIPIFTTTNADQDYYTKERLNGPMTTNKAYGKVATANEHSDDSLSENEAYSDTTRQDLANDSSIPTTENEAYTGVSANTDGMETEETYDYVRNL